MSQNLRDKTSKKLNEFGKEIVEQIKKEQKPTMKIPVRSLSNIKWDETSKLLTLGEKKSKRHFFNVGHARKFMQTLLIASFCKDIVDENIHASIRDMYYNLKHSIGGSHENTFEEQSESDPLIVDIETTLETLRERLHLLADRKGVVVGNVKVRDRGDLIDWSKLGSGGWSIPSVVEDIGFEDVDADFVLVIEKNAGFERLHEDKFWKKYNCILMGTGGQAARGTRRLIKRLADEHKLPVYVLTDSDSILPSEIVIVKNKETGEIIVDEIGKILENHIHKDKNKEIIHLPLEVPAMNENTGEIEWRDIEYAYRHRVDGEILEIKTRGRGTIKVTPAHSLFVFRDNKIKVIAAKDMKEDDYIVVSNSLPSMVGDIKEKEINVASILKKDLDKKVQNKFYAFIKGEKFRLSDTENVDEIDYVQQCNGYQKIKNKIEINEEVGWLLGLWVAEGDRDKKYVRFHLSKKETKKIKKLQNIIKNKLSLKSTTGLEGKNKGGIFISIGSSLLARVFEELNLVRSSGKKEIPSVIFNSPQHVQLNFLKGLFDGDGSIDKYHNLIYYTKSEKLLKQVTNLLLSFKINPTLLEVERGNIRGNILRLPYTRTNPEFRNFFLPTKTIEVMYKNDCVYGLPNIGDVKSVSIHLMNNHGFPYSVKNKLINKWRLGDALKKHKLPNKFRRMKENLLPVLNPMITLVKVKEIKSTKYRGDVFDFGVPDLHSFVGGSGVVFHNSYGWYIYSVIKSGSMALAHASQQLGTPSAKFIGLTISDIKDYKLEKSVIRANERDLKRAKELLDYPWFQKKEWKREIKLMLDKKIKAEIEALSSRGLKFLSETYLPEKLDSKEFLP